MVGTPFDFLLERPPEFEPFDPAGKTLTIEELNVSSPRTITLSGRAMPYQDPSFGGEQRGEITTYPGNPVGTVQILGPVENDTEFEGIWKDRFLRGAVTVQGTSRKYELAQDLVALFDEIRRSGVALRVQWLDQVRLGFLSEFEIEPMRATDIGWTMVFRWYAWGDGRAPRLLSREPEPPQGLLNRVGEVIAVIMSAPEIVRQLQALAVTLVEEIAKTANALFAVLEAIDEVTDAPGALVGSMLSHARELDRRTQDLVSRIGDVAWPSVSGDAPAISGLGTDPVTGRRTTPFTNTVRAEVWKREVASSARALIDFAERAVSERAERAMPKPLRVETVSAQASLYDLSIRFYGTPDYAGFLAASNGLGSAVVPAGTRIKIPPKPSTPGTAYVVGSGRGKRGC